VKTLSAAMITHVQGPTTTLAHCYKLTRTDSVVMGFTDHDVDIVYDGTTYKAMSGLSASSIESTVTAATPNMEIETLLDSVDITESDLIAGVYDYAMVNLFLINWQDHTMGVIPLPGYSIGEVNSNGPIAVAETRGIADALQHPIGRTIAPGCDVVDLGDTRCKLNLTAFTHPLTVTSVASRQVFTDTARTEAIDYFAYGKCTWLTGNNAGRTMDIKANDTGVFTLWLPMGFDIQVGDTATVITGCNRTEARCKALNNFTNYRGFPHLPGLDKAMEYPS